MLRSLLLASLFLALPVRAATIVRQIHVEGGISVIGDIAFVDHGAKLTADARRDLANVARTLAYNPELHVEVQSALQPGLTRELAQRRAAAVRAYLDTHGVDDTRLATRVVAQHDGRAIELVLAQ